MDILSYFMQRDSFLWQTILALVSLGIFSVIVFFAWRILIEIFFRSEGSDDHEQIKTAVNRGGSGKKHH